LTELEMIEQTKTLFTQAQAALDSGDIEQFERVYAEANKTKESVESIQAGKAKLKQLSGDFNRPVNTVPIADKDAANYMTQDTGARNKASYKPSSWIKGLPEMAQPIWVQEQMGVTEKQHAEFQTDTFVKWLRSPSDDIFWKTASLDEVKAMQEDKFVSLTSVTM
jgi:hypothetical protein